MVRRIPSHPPTTPNNMHTRLTSRTALALTLALGLGASLKAQTAAQPSGAASDQPVVLDPFVVNTDKDNGYIATDSLAGGRQASPIRVTPAAMSSITGQFINDLALTNVTDVLKWSLDTLPTNERSGLTGGSGGNVFNFWSVSIRGDAHVQGGNPPTKNYFPTFMTLDTYNIDRVEFDHGPNSILFGIGDLGGAMTSYTKTARFDKNFDNVSVAIDSYGGYRGTVDSNEHVGNLALRLNGVWADEKGWKDGDSHKKLGATLAGDWKFNDGNTHLRFEVEGWKEKKSIYGYTYQDAFSLWNGSTYAATWGAGIANLGANPQTTPGAPGVTGMQIWGQSPYNVLIAGTGKVMNWSGGARAMGTSDINWGGYLRPYSFSYSGATIAALPSKEFAIAPSDGYVKPEDFNTTLTFDQRINDNMEFQASYYYYVDDVHAHNFESASWNPVSIDLNKQMPDGSANPEYGQLYSDFLMDEQVQNHTAHELRGQFSYHFDASPWNVPMKQLFSVSGGEQFTRYVADQYQAMSTAIDPTLSNWNGSNWSQDMVWARMYWDHPQAAINAPSSIKYLGLPFTWYDFNATQNIKYVGGFSQTRLWDDRLNISLGARRDDFEVHKYATRPTNAGQDIAPGSGAGNSYSAGLVGYVTEWLAVVGNVSTNYQPAAGGLAPTVYGAILGASKGTGKTAGLRLSTKDGKYYASVNWYKDTGDNVIGGDTPDFQSIWSDYFKAGGTKTDIGPAGQISGTPGTYAAQMNYVDTYSVNYTGFEFELTANPLKNLRIQVHYSKPKGERTNDGPNGVRYFAQHLPDWQAVAGPANTNTQKLASDLAQAQTNLANWANPVLAGAVVDHMWNAFATYSFTEGAIKGFDVGFGATAEGSRRIDATHGTTPFTTESLMLGYSMVIDTMDTKLHTRFQLNVDNLFGDDTLVFQSYNGNVGMDYNFTPPRKATFSVGVQF